MFLQVGFRIFMNVTPSIANWTSDNRQFSLVFDENPLTDFVELPDDGRAQDELWYSNILCGVLRGALEMVNHASCVALCFSAPPPTLATANLTTQLAGRFECR